MASDPKTEVYRSAYRAGYREGYDNALAEQPFDRAAVIEECAKVAEEFGGKMMPASPKVLIAAAIRALKDKP